MYAEQKIERGTHTEREKGREKKPSHISLAKSQATIYGTKVVEHKCKRDTYRVAFIISTGKNGVFNV